jgi:aspartokinase-like uncharacterized kinase
VEKVILKLGGSLIEEGWDIIRVLRDYAEMKHRRIIIIPGGGPFAEVVRKCSDTLSDDAAHWMAVLAMDQYGLFLANCELPVVENLAEIDGAGQFCILLPYQILKAYDCLPHTWDVTSDTIAAFIAKELGEKVFIKLTDVDGLLDEKGQLIAAMHAKELVDRGSWGCVDAALPDFLIRHEMCCFIINGKFPNRVIDVIEGNETQGTKLA